MMRAMGTKELAAKYGKSKNSTQNVNAAIRAELVAGNEAVDALDTIRTLHEQSGLEQTRRSLAAIRSVVDAMGDEIRKRYDMPPREDQSAAGPAVAAPESGTRQG